MNYVCKWAMWGKQMQHCKPIFTLTFILKLLESEIKSDYYSLDSVGRGLGLLSSSL